MQDQMLVTTLMRVEVLSKNKFSYMKKIFLLLFCLLSFGLSPAPAQAQGFAAELNKQTQAAAGSNGADLGEAADPRTVVARVIQVFLQTLGILLIIYIIYGGTLIFLSGGSEDKVNEGKTVIRRAVIGMIVIMTSYSITIYVSSLVQNSDPCAPDANGDINCATVSPDRSKYNQKSVERDTPLIYDCKMLPDGTCDLQN